MSQKPVGQAMRPAAAPVAALLIADLQRLIEEARRSAAQTVNMGLTLLYWRIGKRIRTDVFGQVRAEYGQEILPTLSAELMPLYGRGFSPRSARPCPKNPPN